MLFLSLLMDILLALGMGVSVDQQVGFHHGAGGAGARQHTVHGHVVSQEHHGEHGHIAGPSGHEPSPAH